jgi:hypothetical protein
VIGKPAKATPLPPYHSCCRPVVVIENAAHSPAVFALETSWLRAVVDAHQ